MKKISDKLIERIKNSYSERASGRVYFPTSVINAYRKELGDYKTHNAILVAEMTDISNRRN